MSADLIPGIITVLILACALGIAMSDHLFFFSHKRLFKSTKDKDIWFVAVGKVQWFWSFKDGEQRNYPYIPVRKLKRVHKYIFEDQGLKGSRTIPDDMTEATEEQFNDETTWSNKWING